MSKKFSYYLLSQTNYYISKRSRYRIYFFVRCKERLECVNVPKVLKHLLKFRSFLRLLKLQSEINQKFLHI